MTAPLHRSVLLMGEAAMQRLEASHVMVVGLGAVGSFAVEALARAGVGRLTLVDHDTVQPSNINRQLYALHSTIGRGKTELAAARARDIRPEIDVRPLELFVEPLTVGALLDERPDALLDAIDSVGPKTALLAEASRRAVPHVVSCMGAANRLEIESPRIDDLKRTHGCPLARLVRKRLRRQGVQSGIRCVYLPSPFLRPRLPDGGEPPPEPTERGRPRRVHGSLACVTGVFGLVAAHEVIRLLTRSAT